MAVNSYDPTTGRPIFVDTDAPDIKVDPTEAAKYAADVGNRVIRANLATLDAYPYKRAGLKGHALDTGADYVHSGTGWVSDNGVGGGLFSTAAGFVTIGSTSGLTVTFPAGRFTVPPAVFATPQNNGTVVVPHVTAITATSFLLRMYTLSGVAVASGNCAWFAVQKTPTAVGG